MDIGYLTITIVLALISYLAGSIPFGFLIAKAKGIDPRESGSGNIGATNIARSIGFVWFFPVFFLDMSKGFLPVFIPQILMNIENYRLIIFASASILGHMTTPFLMFKGGKGVATGFGAIIALDYYSSLFALALFLFTFLISRIISLSSCVAATGLAVFYCVSKGFGDKQLPFSIFFIAIAIIIILKHRSNFVRIIKGTEPRIKQ